MKPYSSNAPGDLLVGFTIAKGTKSMKVPVAFRRSDSTCSIDGARWGIAAMIMGAEPDALYQEHRPNSIVRSGVAGGKNGAAALDALIAGGAATGPGTSTDGSGNRDRRRSVPHRRTIHRTIRPMTRPKTPTRSDRRPHSPRRSAPTSSARSKTSIRRSTTRSTRIQRATAVAPVVARVDVPDWPRPS